MQARDAAVLTLLYACGLRISEALSLTSKQVQSNPLVILGKGGKTGYGEKNLFHSLYFNLVSFDHRKLTESWRFRLDYFNSRIQMLRNFMVVCGASLKPL